MRLEVLLDAKQVSPMRSRAASESWALNPLRIAWCSAWVMRSTPSFAGAVGMFTMVSARVMGADVWIVDVIPERHKIAKAMDAKYAYNCAR